MSDGILTDEEAKFIMCQSCDDDHPQTEEEMYAVLKHCETIRCDEAILHSVLNGTLQMFMKDGEIMLKRAPAMAREIAG